ncbi:MAG: hypothetical protein ACRDSL_12265, partial [Pseudonocardiaceae bacterium]
GAVRRRRGRRVDQVQQHDQVLTLLRGQLTVVDRRGEGVDGIGVHGPDLSPVKALADGRGHP